jgi:hypothetical protein
LTNIPDDNKPMPQKIIDQKRDDDLQMQALKQLQAQLQQKIA